MQTNSNAVSRAQWRKWSETARRVFNETYSFGVFNKKLCMHPKARAINDEQWNTTAWNLAWIAADAVAED